MLLKHYRHEDKPPDANHFDIFTLQNADTSVLKKEILNISDMLKAKKSRLFLA